MPRPGKCNKTILLVDDEQTERTIARQILHGEGCTVLVADCCASALRVFEANRDRIDLLIADIALPDGNGCDLALLMRDAKPDLRVLFISGHVGAEVCRYYGFDVTDQHFLKKRFRAAQLIKSVQRVLSATEAFPRLVPKSRTA